MTPVELLRIYDDQLRGEAEVASTKGVRTHGPLFWAQHGDDGFVTYRSLADVESAELDRLIMETIAHFRDETSSPRFEWKTCGHDRPEDLTERLTAAGFVAEEVETVMMGEAARLVGEVELPAGVAVRRIAGEGARADLERMVALQEDVFGALGSFLDHVLEVFEEGTSQFWIAEADGEVISAGRLTPVPGTEVAGIWGGATRADWRGRGVYRALVAARARWALEHGCTHLHSDCTAMSRPILERSGLVAVTTTTPYIWRR